MPLHIWRIYRYSRDTAEEFAQARAAASPGRQYRACVSKGWVLHYHLGKLRLFKKADLAAGMERFRITAEGEILV
jgi:hypothetical protein